MKSLQLLPIEEWPLLRDSLKRDWPTYAYYYNWIQVAIRWRTIKPDLKHEIYCPNGNYESGAFVGTSDLGLYTATIFSFQESKIMLKEALKQTKILKWNKGILFNAVHEHFVDIIEEILDEMKKRKGFKMVQDTTYYYFKSKEDCAKQESPKIPDDCLVKHLNVSNIPLIHSIWPHRNLQRPDSSKKYLENFVVLNKGVGLFLKEDDSLVSWILYGEIGHLGMLQTLEDHKRKGYGKIVTQIISKELAIEENLDSVLFIVSKNVASQKLFESLNYQRLTSATWFVTEPFDEQI